MKAIHSSLNQIRVAKSVICVLIISGILLGTGCEKDDPATPMPSPYITFRVFLKNINTPIANAKILVYAREKIGGSILRPNYRYTNIDSLLTDSTGQGIITRSKYNLYNEQPYDGIVVSVSMIAYTRNGITKLINLGWDEVLEFPITCLGYFNLFITDGFPLNPEITHVDILVNSYGGLWPVLNFPDNYNAGTGHLISGTGYENFSFHARYKTENDSISGNDLDSSFTLYLTGFDTTAFQLNY